MTPRAIETLRSVSLIAAEDTRVARRLMTHFDIATPLTAFHGDASEPRAEEILSRLDAGEDVAVTSDAGMPAISDPGSLLVRGAIERGHRVLPIPGASAVIAAAAVSGVADRGFVFGGFLPRKTGDRRERLLQLLAPGLPLILFEAPTRMAALLEFLAEEYPEAQVTLGREITKLHEEWLRGRPAELLLEMNARGEFTVVIDAPTPPSEADRRLDATLRQAMELGLSVRDSADLAATACDVPRKRAYHRALEIRDESGEGD